MVISLSPSEVGSQLQISTLLWVESAMSRGQLDLLGISSGVDRKQESPSIDAGIVWAIDSEVVPSIDVEVVPLVDVEFVLSIDVAVLVSIDVEVVSLKSASSTLLRSPDTCCLSPSTIM
ncbi:hypothetical protein DY000_02006830 [Brassica cretica]|uniref:Uncharacterized protein n=1 Tax=Brassica cretica TaxID=69181 RepID=A0ABQ7BXW8_BRACR|nr:hypothetical protein DY000_02006830 [Brassica cretica]